MAPHRAARAVSYAYMRQIAQAADDLGYEGVLIPTGKSCEDPWVVASTLVPVTKRLKFLVAVRPGLQAPVVSARQTATLDRLSGGRLLINVVTGGDPVELEGDGLFLGHDERYRLTDEFLTVWRKALTGETVNFEGKHIKVRGAKLLYPPVRRTRRSISAARRAPARKSPPIMSIFISPGASRRIRWQRRSTWCAGWPLRAGARYASASASTSLSAKRRRESLGGGRRTDQVCRR